MTLYPLRGIDELAFGSPLSAITSRLGVPTNTRLVTPVSLSKMLDYDQHDLTLGFDLDYTLAFIAIGGGAADTELWGDRPFQLRSENEQNFSAPLLRWLASKAKKSLFHCDCLGESISVPTDGVVFCLASSGGTILAGIQLESPLHSTGV